MRLLAKIAKRLRQLARDERGDSLVEVLVAILIAALGAAALATMVTVAVNVSTSMEQERSRLYAAESSLQSSGAVGILKVAIDGEAVPDIKVTVQQDPDGTFAGYIDETSAS